MSPKYHKAIVLEYNKMGEWLHVTILNSFPDTDSNETNVDKDHHEIGEEATEEATAII